MTSCPKDCKANGKGALAHVNNPECVWREEKDGVCDLQGERVETV